MEDSEEHWKAEAEAIYRTTMVGMTDRWSKLEGIEGAYLADELREALHDLKLAVMEEDYDFYVRAAKDVRDVFDRLKKRYREQP